MDNNRTGVSWLGHKYIIVKGRGDCMQKVAVVTGASKGIGKCIAQRLAEEGYFVYGLARSEGKAEGVHYLSCDVSDEERVKEIFEQIISETSQIDLLVNNAGIGISGAVEFTTSADMKHLFEVNLYSSIYCTQQVIDIMRKNGGGRVIFISSLGAPFVIPFQTLYSASKAALNALIEGLSMELAQFHIEVCGIMPGDRKSSFQRMKNQLGDDIYHGAIHYAVSKMEMSEANGAAPDTIAQDMLKILRMDKIPLFFACDDYGTLYEWSGMKNREKIAKYMAENYMKLK